MDWKTHIRSGDGHSDSTAQRETRRIGKKHTSDEPLSSLSPPPSPPSEEEHEEHSLAVQPQLQTRRGELAHDPIQDALMIGRTRTIASENRSANARRKRFPGIRQHAKCKPINGYDSQRGKKACCVVCMLHRPPPSIVLDLKLRPLLARFSRDHASSRRQTTHQHSVCMCCVCLYCHVCCSAVASSFASSPAGRRIRIRRQSCAVRAPSKLPPPAPRRSSFSSPCAAPLCSRCPRSIPVICWRRCLC